MHLTQRLQPGGVLETAKIYSVAHNLGGEHIPDNYPDAAPLAHGADFAKQDLKLRVHNVWVVERPREESNVAIEQGKAQEDPRHAHEPGDHGEHPAHGLVG